MIVSGSYNINSENGKGIKAKENLYLGKKSNQNYDLLININTLNEGIQAKNIDIFSGTINIEGKNNGISVINEVCKNEKCFGNCNCYIKIYDGILNINSEVKGIISDGDLFVINGQLKLFVSLNGEDQPITTNGLFKIKGGIFLYGGKKINVKLFLNNSQSEYFYNKYLKAKTSLKIYANNENNYNYINEIISMKIPKNIEYLYFNLPNPDYLIKLDENEIDKSGIDLRTLITSELESVTEYSNNISQKNINKYDKNQTLPSIQNDFDYSKDKDDTSKENININSNNNICSFIKNKNILLFLFGITLF